VKVVVICSTLLLACRSLPGGNSSCAPVGAAEVNNVTPGQTSALAGAFRLILVDTAAPGGRIMTQERLRLAVADSVTRARSREREIGKRPRRDLQLVGSVSVAGFARPDTAEVDAGVLFTGCRDCTDASPSVHQILKVTSVGFAGTWRNDQSGIVVLVDAHGARRPNPAGYYCAQRE
jgi:hypothetical protein